ncbi:MAG: DUF5336 domain-containing protein [Mycobacterium sp.]
MSYPQGAPGGPGYLPAQQSNAQFSAPTQQFSTLPESDPAGAGTNKLAAYFAAAVALLGLLVYVGGLGPQFTAGSEIFITPFRIDLAVAASMLAAMTAGVGLLPKQTARPALVAVLSLLGFLLVISIVLTAPSGVTVDWGMYLIVAFTAIQAIVAVSGLLLDAGIINAPAPRPKYEQPPQYGQYPGSYYGQPQQGAPTHQQTPPPQHPGYPSPYGGSGYPSTGPSTGGFPAASQSGQSGPPTPPTGFPTYGQPPASNVPTAQVPTQHQSPSSPQSDQTSS